MGLDYEKNYPDIELIAGVDEAGRGPLAGPVACAAVIMPKDPIIEGVDDSKKLTPEVREQLFEIITKTALSYSIAFIDNKTIDRINILQATKLGMEKAISGLNLAPQLVLVDAVKGLNVPFRTESIIKGDALSYNIAAASILAKVARDRLMREYQSQFPQYSFGTHKGYCTPRHIEEIRKFGRCEIHRQSFLVRALEGDDLEQQV